MKRSLSAAVSICALCVLSACGGGGGGGTQKTLSISGTLPSTGTVGAAYTGTLSAVGGVAPYTWTVTGMPAGVTPTASTTATETVMGTPSSAATSTVSVSLSDSSGLSASQTFMVVISTTTAVFACTARGNESVLTASSPFAFLVKGYDVAGTPIAIAGSFTPNGDGTIKASAADYTGFSTGHVQLSVNLAMSSYAFGSDNRGCLTLSGSAVQAAAQSARKAGVAPQFKKISARKERTEAALATPVLSITFSFVLGEKTGSGFQSGRIIEFDSTYGATGDSIYITAGKMHVQTPADFTLESFQSNYAFGVDGWDPKVNRIALAGTFMNASGALSGGVADYNDLGLEPSVSGELDGGTGTINATIDGSTGRGTGSISVPLGENTFLAFDFSFYIVNGSDFYIVSTDPPTAVADSSGLLSGQALATNASFTPGSLNGFYLLAGLGFDTNAFVYGYGGANVAEIGNFQASSAGAIIGGNIYLNDADDFGIQAISGGTYVTQTSGRTTITATGSGAPVCYLTGPSSDENIISFFVGTDIFATSGAGYLQTTAAPNFSATILNSSFAMSSDADLDDFNEAIDGVFTFDGVSKYSAVIDDNAFFGAGQQTPGQTTTGTFTMNTDGSGILSFPEGLIHEGLSASWAILTNGTQIFAIDNVTGVDPLLYIFTIEEQPD
jgi:hypothetical protein